jgi:hypothetical protein
MESDWPPKAGQGNLERGAKYARDSMSSTGREAQLFNRVRALYRAEVIFNMTMVGIGLWMREWKNIERGKKYVIVDIYEDYCAPSGTPGGAAGPNVAREKVVYLTLDGAGSGEILTVELRKIPLATIESITPSETYIKFRRSGR